MLQDIFVGVIGLAVAIYVVIKVYQFIRHIRNKNASPMCPGCSMNCHESVKKSKSEGGSCPSS